MTHTLGRGTLSVCQKAKKKKRPIAPKRHHQKIQQTHPILLTSYQTIIRQNEPQLSRRLGVFLTLTPNVKNMEHGRNPHSNEIRTELTPQILDLAIREGELFL